MTQLVQLYPTLHITHHQIMLITLQMQMHHYCGQFLMSKQKCDLITLDSSLQESCKIIGRRQEINDKL